jgi:hypothetical protein
MAAMPTRLAALAALAGIGAELLGHCAFTRLVRRDVEALRDGASTARAGMVTEEMLSGVPEPVRRYLTCTGVAGGPFVRMVRLRQKGAMRPGPGPPWMPLAAEDHYCVDPPGFVWDGTLRLGPVRVGRARDEYVGGAGRMLVKVASLLPVAGASGEEMDQGSMMGYLSEMIFFPAAFPGANISFQAVDHGSAQVTLTGHGRTATGPRSLSAGQQRGGHRRPGPGFARLAGRHSVAGISGCGTIRRGRPRTYSAPGGADYLTPVPAPQGR